MAERRNLNTGDFDAKGDILAGTANDAFDQLAVGVDGQAVVADSTQSTGLGYGMPGPYGGKSYRTTMYYSADIRTSTTAASLIAESLVTAVPFWCRKTSSFDRIVCRQTVNGSAGALHRMGIYEDDGSVYPGALLLDAGTVVADAGGGVAKEITINQQLVGGQLYWLVRVTQGAAVTRPNIFVAATPGSVPAFIATPTSGNSQGSGFTESGVSGALPASFTTSLSLTTVPAWMWLRAV